MAPWILSFNLVSEPRKGFLAPAFSTRLSPIASSATLSSTYYQAGSTPTVSSIFRGPGVPIFFCLCLAYRPPLIPAPPDLPSSHYYCNHKYSPHALFPPSPSTMVSVFLGFVTNGMPTPTAWSICRRFRFDGILPSSPHSEPNPPRGIVHR